MWLLISMALADCPANNSALAESLTAAEDAYANLETDGFTKNLDEAFAQFDCLEERIDTSNASRLHWNAALGAFMERDLDLARKHFLAGRIAAPGGKISDSLAPEGSEVYEAYEALTESEVETQTVESNSIATYIIDGSVASTMRDSLPKLVQIETSEGAPGNHLLFPGASLPPLPEPATPAKEKKPLKPHVPMIILGGAAMASAGVMTAVFKSEADDLRDELEKNRAMGLPDPNLERRKQLKTLGTVVTPTLFATGAGITAGGVLVWAL